MPSSKKKFFLSLVQGESYLYMYLTWKGKQGTQGIELAAVTEVLSGIQTDVLRKSGKPQHAERYLSLVLPERIPVHPPSRRDLLPRLCGLSAVERRAQRGVSEPRVMVKQPRAPVFDKRRLALASVRP